MFNLNKAPKAIQLASESSPQMKIVCVDGDIPELMVMDYIGSDGWGGGVPASEVKSFLKANKNKPVRASFNSFGGDAYEGIVMHNAFQDHGNVTGVIEGIAFSAASIAITGTSRIVMQEASNFGIHHALTLAYGNAQAMRGVTEWLDAVDENQIAIFTAKTGKSRDEIIAYLDGTDDGTVFSAADAFDAGFVDEIIPIKTRAKANAERVVASSYDRIRAEIRQKQIKALKK